MLNMNVRMDSTMIEAMPPMMKNDVRTNAPKMRIGMVERRKKEIPKD